MCACHMEAGEAFLSSRWSESWQRERQAFPTPHPSLFFSLSRPVTRRRRDVCVFACLCELWISVLLHNKSLLNKCKADGTVVSPPCGGKEREKEREKRRERKREKKHSYFSTADTLVRRITQTVTGQSCETFNPGVEVKGGSWMLMDTQTHSVYERTFCWSLGAVDINDRVDIMPERTKTWLGNALHQQGKGS